MLNDYNTLAHAYQKTDVKPDKRYSTLPTVLEMAGSFENETILDLGCGTGFFTKAFVQAGAGKVIGLDNSAEQIELAKQGAVPNTEFLLRDMFTDQLPSADIVVAPYVLNYSKTTKELEELLRRIHSTLNEKGRLLGVIDLPTGQNLQQFGAVHLMQGERKDEAPIEIQLFDKGDFICTLHAVYFTRETVEMLLHKVGFTNVLWHNPIVSEEGKQKHPELNWEEYILDPELGYFVAQK